MCWSQFDVRQWHKHNLRNFLQYAQGHSFVRKYLLFFMKLDLFGIIADSHSVHLCNGDFMMRDQMEC